MKRRDLAARAFALSLFASAPAAADDAPNADALYREGQRLVAEGRVHEGCVKLEASQRADPALGTLLALATCHEREGRIASAWREYTEAITLADAQSDRERGDYARSHAAALEAKVHRIVVSVATPPPDVRIAIGENSVGATELAGGVALDPGRYEITAAAAGKNPWRRTVVVPATGGKTDVTVMLEDARPSEATGGMSTRRVVALATVGAGVLFAGAGAVALGSASSQSDDALDEARASITRRDRNGYARAQDAHDDATSTQALGIVALALGGVALGTGAVLWLTGGERRSPPPSNARLFFGPVCGVVGTF